MSQYIHKVNGLYFWWLVLESSQSLVPRTKEFSLIFRALDPVIFTLCLTEERIEIFKYEKHVYEYMFYPFTKNKNSFKRPEQGVIL